MKSEERTRVNAKEMKALDRIVGEAVKAPTPAQHTVTIQRGETQETLPVEVASCLALLRIADSLLNMQNIMVATWQETHPLEGSNVVELFPDKEPEGKPEDKGPDGTAEG